MNKKNKSSVSKHNSKKASLRFLKILSIFAIYFVYVFLFFFYLNNSNRLVRSSLRFRVGDLSPSDIVAQKNVKFIDDYATKIAKEKAAFDAPSVYIRDDSKLRRAVYLLNTDKNYDPSNLENYNRLEIILNDICKRGFFDINELMQDKNQKIEFEDVLYNKDELLTSSNIYSYIFDKYRNEGDGESNPKNENFIFNSIMRYLNPNAVYNIFESKYREEVARESVEPVLIDIKKGDVVVAKDEIITEHKYQILEKLNVLEQSYSKIAIVVCLLVGLVLMFCAFYFIWTSDLSKSKFHSNQEFYLLLFFEFVFLVLSIAILFADLKFNLGFMPYLSLLPLPSVCSFVLTKSRKTTYSILVMNLLLFVQIPFINWQTIMRSAIVVALIVELLFNENLKLKLSKKIFLSGFLFILTSFLIDYSSLRLSVILSLQDSIGELFKILFCIGTAKFFVFIAENIFNFPTKRVLNRLITLDSALIDKFKSLCPGSFEHSETVMDIAEEAAVRIGANSLLVKAAARFHDIGKMEHPEYFVENQRSDVSRHQMLKNSLSGAIIRSHVPLGVNLLKQNNFPPEVIELVNEHHGNDVITYFYINAQKEAEEGIQVSKSDFSYQSNPPSSKESGILMLCDVCEAATRSRKEYQDFKELGNFVHTLIQGKISAGQLDNSFITIGELRLIEESIISTLKSKLHKRIKYPDAPQASKE